ncbi:hypothetical protein ACKKBG_A28745 [Auxenochlorella protothecoides x Auxenochlorella symbiontica]
MLSCATATFDTGLKSLLARTGPHFVHFQGSWCGDCLRTNKGVEQAVSKTGGALLRVAVGDKPEWRSPDHALRQDSRTKLRVIPTLIHWTEGGPGARLESELESAPTEAEAEKVTLAFIEQCRS